MSRRMLSGIATVVGAVWVGHGCGGGSTAGVDSGTKAGASATPIKVNAGPRLTLRNATKVDLLFDIDNSPSMSDKQAYLAEAIPDLVRRLVTPNCVDSTGHPTGAISDAYGNCASGTVEYPPVHDMHVGVVTSSLGPRLGDLCKETETQATAQGPIPRHNDDQGHLINRGSDPANLANFTESPLADMGTVNFLSWFPAVPANNGRAPTPGATPIGDPAELVKDFASLVVGTHAFGCGIESQLESWYRFLIQPDPYASLSWKTRGTAQAAQLVGIDTTILAQRAAFLRPDSLVAIVVLSDENDSEVDLRSFHGTGWNFMNSVFDPPRGTTICATKPEDPGCTSCAFGKNPGDSQCMMWGDGPGLGSYTDLHDWGKDINLRHVREKEKYGVSVQYPIERYVLGLTSTVVPDRNGEYGPDANDDPNAPPRPYQGLDASSMRCTNPLFAATLPVPPTPANWQPTADEVCHLPPGKRSVGSIYYMHIGGVPHQLLQEEPRNPDSPQKTTLATADWTLILGKDPLDEDYTGIDPHMVESYRPRTNAPVPTGGFPVATPTSPEGADRISGREWTTNSRNAEHADLLVDVEYACTFKLAAPRDCSAGATAADPALSSACDCLPPTANTGSFTPDQIPAVCNSKTPTTQDYAKAYPTVRELLLAKLVGEVPGANQGVVSSICPIHDAEVTPGDPLYGYRPAIAALIDRCK